LAGSSDIYVLVLGASGTGKTTFIHSITGCGDPDAGLNPSTDNVTVYEGMMRQQRVKVVDTPGFENGGERGLGALVLWLKSQLSNNHPTTPQFSGVLYLHRVTDNRISRVAELYRDRVLKLVGKQNLSNVVLGTTMWDQVSDQSVASQRQRELQGGFWKKFLTGEPQSRAKVEEVRPDNRVGVFLKFLDNRPRTLQIQEDLRRHIELSIGDYFEPLEI
jgi:energy-coupling factor transporter ATP-binding protein EcfA2